MPSITYDRLTFVLSYLQERYGIWVPKDAIQAELKLSDIPLTVLLDEARRTGLIKRSKSGYALKKTAKITSPDLPRNLEMRRLMRPPKPRKRRRKVEEARVLPSDFDADVILLRQVLESYNIRSSGDVRIDGADVLGWAPTDTDVLSVVNRLEALKPYAIWWVRLGAMIHVHQRDINRDNADRYQRYNQYGMIDAYVNFRLLGEAGPAIVAFEELVRRNKHHDIPIWLVDLGCRPDGKKPFR